MDYKYKRWLALSLTLLIFLTVFVPFTAEARLKSSWSRNYGGDFHDIAHEVLVTEDEGYLLAGYSNSFGPERRYQMWVVKTNSNGYTEWRRDIGGEYSDRAYAADNTEDGGFVLAGSTTSYGGRDNEDFYLVNIDGEGDVEWENNFGGDHDEIAYDVIQTSDGGYLIGGSTVTFGHRGRDWWIVRADEEGEEIWSRYYGGDQDEMISSVVETEEGNFVLGGSTASYGDPGFGFWSIEIDEEKIDEEKEEDPETGKEGVELEEEAIVWETNVGGFLDDKVHDMVLTQDGGFAAAGETRSYTELGTNFWLIKLDSEGTEQWNESYGGEFEEVAYSLIQTREGNFMMTGYETTYGGVQEDIFVVETDEEGEELFRYDTGGERTDIAYSIVEVDEDSFAVAGKTRSFGGGGFSFYLVKLGRPTGFFNLRMVGYAAVGIITAYVGIKVYKKYRYRFGY